MSARRQPAERGSMANSVLLMAWRKRWNRNLLRFLGSRARQPDIEDLAQETYLRLLRAPDLRDVRMNSPTHEQWRRK